MSEKRLTPKRRFKGFSGDWEEKKLGTLLEISSAARVHKNEWTMSGVRFFRTSDVISSFKGTSNIPAFISYQLYEKLSKQSGCIKSGDILVTGGGTIGIPYLIEDNEPLYFKDADLIWFKNNDVLNSYFLYYYFISPMIKNYIASITHIGTISHYTIEQAKLTPLSLPNKKEQTRIGDFFKQLDNLISLQQKKIDKLKATKQAYLSEMFPADGEKVPKRRFKGFSWDWEEMKLGEIFEYERPDKYIVKNEQYSNDFTTPVLTANKSFILGYTEETNTYNKPSIIFDDFTLDCKFVDFCYMLKSSALKILTTKDNHDLRFAFELLNFTELENLGHARHYISVVQVKEVLIPSLKEQTLIGNFFKEFDEHIRLQNRKLEKFQNIKHAFLNEMFV